MKGCLDTAAIRDKAVKIGFRRQKMRIGRSKIATDPSFFFPFFFFAHLLSSFWTSRGHRCRPFFPPGTCHRFLSRIGFSNPTARRFTSSVANSRSRAFRKSICAQEKVPPRTYSSMHSGGLELAKLTYTRLEDNLIRHRGDRLYKAVAALFRAATALSMAHFRSR